LLRILQRVDKSFSRSREKFRAINDEGYLVDLIKPARNPPWIAEAARVGNDPGDLSVVEITGLSWRESAPAFVSTAIYERGGPLRIVTSDPRVFAAHKFWLSRRHLPFAWEPLRMLPKELVEEVKPLFDVAAASTNSTSKPTRVA
jgi:hypothetical protein